MKTWSIALQEKPASPKALGHLAESLAIDKAKADHYQLVTRNYHCRLGEIDLILLSPEKHLAFVEVKARLDGQATRGFESITPHKQFKIRQTAEVFLMKNASYQQHDCRLDAISAVLRGSTLHFAWLERAF